MHVCSEVHQSQFNVIAALTYLYLCIGQILIYIGLCDYDEIHTLQALSVKGKFVTSHFVL